jgi:hypothetical protein
MSKNLTRKGLALGAVVALGSTLFAGAPAFAANELNLQPSLGTTYGSVIGETFTLNVNTNPGYASSEFVGTKLKYNVVNASKAALTITAGGAANAGSVNAGAADNSNYVVTAQSPSTSAANSIAIATAATATSSVTVQAWVDSDFDSVIDSGEWSSAVQTVTFNKASEVTWTTEFTQPAIGDTKFAAYVSAAPSINVAQLTNTSAGILFTTGSTGANTSKKVLTSAANFDSTTGKLKFNDLLSGLTTVSTGVGSTVAAGRYSAQAFFKAGGSAAVTDLVGSEVAYAVAAATVSTIESATSADSDNVINVGGVDTTGNNVETIRATATSVPMSVLVKDSTGAALKNTAVTVYVEENAAGGTDTNSTTAVGNYDTSSFTAGGLTLKDTTSSVTRESIKFSVTTDADGKANFTITAAAQNGDALKVYASAQGVNTTPSNYATLTWTTAVPASLKNNNVQGTSAVLKQAAGSTFTLNYTVIDQFGAAIPTADKYRVVLSDGTDSFYPTVSAGKASQAITLASTATGTKTYTSVIQAKGTDGNYANLSSSIAGADLSVVVGTSTAAAKITTTGDITTVGTQAALSTTDTNTIAKSSRTSVLDTVAFVAGDKNAGATNTVAGTTTTGVVVAGTVADVTGANTYASVTLSGSGLNFIAGGTLYGAGTVTVQTDASGAFAGVRVLSTKAGKRTLTVTSGSASSTYVLDFGSAADNSGTAIELTAPASILPGKTLVITGKVVDKFGNGVTVVSDNVNRGFSVAYDGPGLVIGDLPSKTDASGEFGFRVLLGADEAGSATVTVSYDADGTTTTKAAITKTATVVIGKAVAAVKANVVGKTKAFSVSVSGNASAKNVVVKVAGKTVATLKGSASAKTYTVKATMGSKKVTVYVGGKLIATKTVSVK